MNLIHDIGERLNLCLPVASKEKVIFLFWKLLTWPGFVCEAAGGLCSYLLVGLCSNPVIDLRSGPDIGPIILIGS